MDLFQFSAMHRDLYHRLIKPRLKEGMKDNFYLCDFFGVLIKKIVSAMSWIHKQGIVHLDLSLENIIIHTNINDISQIKTFKQWIHVLNTAHIQIIDFGAAEYILPDNFDSNHNLQTLKMLSVLCVCVCVCVCLRVCLMCIYARVSSLQFAVCVQ